MQSPQDRAPKPGYYVLKTDGGIRAEQGAAGQAAIGVVLKDHKYRDVDEISAPIGWARNHHEAEYKALIAGLELARRHRVDRLRVFSDSTLVVNTVNGDWNLQPEHLKPLCSKASGLLEEFRDIQLSWVPRGMNVEADALASKALGRGR
jgi:ribonuclease HI